MMTRRPANASFRFGCLVAISMFTLPSLALGQGKICQQDSQQAAVAYVLDLKNKADAILKKNKDPLASLKIQLLTTVEFDPLAKFALGRFWYRATTGQRVEYQGLFRKTVLHTLASYVLELRGAKVEITRQYPIETADILVKSRVFLPNGKTMAIDWRIGFNNCHPLAVDLLKDGVSLMMTKHHEFDAVATRLGIDGLLTELKGLAARQDQMAQASELEEQYVRTLLNQLLQETAKKLRLPDS